MAAALMLFRLVAAALPLVLAASISFDAAAAASGSEADAIGEEIRRLKDSPILLRASVSIEGVAEELERNARKLNLEQVAVEIPGDGEWVLDARGRRLWLRIASARVTARGKAESAHGYLRFLTLRPTLTAFDEVTFEARPDGSVSLEVRVRVPVHAIPPEDETGESPGKSLLEQDRDELARAQIVLDTLGSFESAQARSPVDALATFYDVALRHYVVLHRLRIDAGSVAVSGFALSSSERDDLQSHLEDSGFEVADLRTADAGRCQSFSLELTFEALLPGDPKDVGAFMAGIPPACTPDR